MPREFDSPWKDTLDEYLESAMALFHPVLHADIDWSLGYQKLDAELSEIVRDAELGQTVADRLFRVTMKDSRSVQLLIHIEVQTQYDSELARRMYVYQYRLFDCYNDVIEAIAILGDDRPNWRPQEFTQMSKYGTSIRYTYHVVKLLDWHKEIRTLIDGHNPAGIVVAAHLRSLSTFGNDNERKIAKLELIRSIIDRGWLPLEIRKIYRLIDWLLELPVELQKQLRSEIRAYEEEKMMPYVISDERIARAEGVELGRVEGRVEGLLNGIGVSLGIKFGEAGEEFAEEIRSLDLPVDQLVALLQAVRKAKLLVELRDLVQSH